MDLDNPDEFLNTLEGVIAELEKPALLRVCVVIRPLGPARTLYFR